MNKFKTCFFIAPIGDEDTHVREESDALLWVAKSALEKYGFNVIRVDQIARTAVITNEIVQLIQEAELCLIVLTGENPNVFYEAGRRHETGKPFIQLIKREVNIPFDVAGIRTIQYSEIEKRAAVAKLIEDIQRFVDEFEKSGYGSTGSGVSMSTLAASLDRVERKLARLESRGASVPALPQFAAASAATESGSSQSVPGPGFTGLAALFGNPRELYLKALLSGNVEQAGGLLRRLEEFVEPKELTSAALMLVAAGYEPAVETVLRILTDHFEDLGDPRDESGELIRHAVATVASFYHSTDREKEGYDRLEPIIREVLKIDDLPAKSKASYLNQLQRLLYGMGEYERALEICEDVLELNAEEASFWYNASLIYEKLELPSKSAEAIDKALALGDQNEKPDDDHLRQAVEAYVRVGRLADAKEAHERLKVLSPFKALVFDDEVREALGIHMPLF